jgi:hypothetical protein
MVSKILILQFSSLDTDIFGLVVCFRSVSRTGLASVRDDNDDDNNNNVQRCWFCLLLSKQRVEKILPLASKNANVCEVLTTQRRELDLVFDLT